MRDFYSLTRQDLESYCAQHSFAPVHADSIFRDVYKRKNLAFETSRRIPKKLSKNLAIDFSFRSLGIRRIQVSKYDLSVKFLLTLEDGNTIESVLMPEKSRFTLCVSSQVGCAQGCVFCFTGKMGLVRNLTSGEIVGQILVANKWILENPDWFKKVQVTNTREIHNVVFMGMGEPLDNIENVLQSIRVMIDPLGLAMAQKRISVSTAGHLPGIKRLLEEFPNIPLALSLHSPNNGARSRIMPINKKWPLSEVIQYLEGYFRSGRKRKLLIQYTLISGVNDGEQEALKLVELIKNIPAKVNLIPLNTVEATRFSSPESEYVARFRDLLHTNGVRVMVRYSKGQDIDAACGQLVERDQQENRASQI